MKTVTGPATFQQVPATVVARGSGDCSVRTAVLTALMDVTKNRVTALAVSMVGGAMTATPRVLLHVTVLATNIMDFVNTVTLEFGETFAR